MVHLYRRKREVSYFGLLVSILLFIGILLLFWRGFVDVGASQEERQAQALAQAARRAAVSCYAIEGAYPQSVSYLEEHYGLVYDHTAYRVSYETIGSNISPQIQVIALK